ncbi:MAG: metallophosphoesterase [Vicinamibacterales bacterium]
MPGEQELQPAAPQEKLPLKAIVVSDLHLGEACSVFSAGDGPDVSFCAEAGAALARLIASGLSPGQQRAEYLVLAGDVLDLSLGSRASAFLGFKALLAHLAALFDALIYVPGNHDHHIWVALQEEARIFAQIREGQPVLPYYDALIPTIDHEGLVLPTPIAGGQAGPLPTRPIGRRTFLYQLLPAAARDRQMDFLVAYPNVHLRLEAQRTLVTHGHFFEDAWTLFTDALPSSLGAQTLTYEELERFNSPFTEFGWYHLGQAGALSEILERIWREFQSSPRVLPPTLEQVAEEVAGFVDERLDFTPAQKTGLRRFFASRIEAPVKEWSSDRVVHLWLEVLNRFVMSQLKLYEGDIEPGSALRDTPDMFADPRKAAKVRRYLRMAENAADPFRPTALVFGHTHVPTVLTALETDTGTVITHNTGGWLVDNSDPLLLSISRPSIVAIDEGGALRHIPVPWPTESEFWKAAAGCSPEASRREAKRLVQATLHGI